MPKVEAQGATAVAEVGLPSRPPPRPRAPDAKDASPEDPERRLDTASILALRQRHVGPNVALFFKDAPLHVVAARGCTLYDAEGGAYLDCINNVSHVGHAHPAVAAAVASQLATLNTNCRYLHSGLPRYCARLAATMPAPLSTVYMVCSGSEANDLAWRVACANARRGAAAGPAADSRPLHALVMDHGYHGHTSLCIDLSPYKFNGPGAAGLKRVSGSSAMQGPVPIPILLVDKLPRNSLGSFVSAAPSFSFCSWRRRLRPAGVRPRPALPRFLSWPQPGRGSGRAGGHRRGARCRRAGGRLLLRVHHLLRGPGGLVAAGVAWLGLWKG